VASVIVLVCGSRKVADPGATRQAIDARLSLLPTDATIIHGAAHGVDMWADGIAYSRGLKTRVFVADWEQHGRSAGILRNNLMLDLNPDLVIAFWDGESRGTKHTIEEAERRRIPVEIILLEPVWTA
jgi:hypothetical protein